MTRPIGQDSLERKTARNRRGIESLARRPGPIIPEAGAPPTAYARATAVTQVDGTYYGLGQLIGHDPVLYGLAEIIGTVNDPGDGSGAFWLDPDGAITLVNGRWLVVINGYIHYEGPGTGGPTNMDALLYADPTFDDDSSIITPESRPLIFGGGPTVRFAGQWLIDAPTFDPDSPSGQLVQLVAIQQSDPSDDVTIRRYDMTMHVFPASEDQNILT